MQICCSSPERFLKAGQDGWLEARPIKGTAKRHADDPEADQAAAQALVSSEKDRAENLMIVDLMRNDLGRVCQVITCCRLLLIPSIACLSSSKALLAVDRPGIISRNLRGQCKAADA